MEVRLCRSGRTRAARTELWWELGRRWSEMTGACGGGKTVPLGHQEPLCGKTKRGMVMKASPAAPLEVAQAQLLFQFLVVALDDPAVFGGAHQLGQ